MNCPVNKVDSNIVGLAYAEEACLGILPGEEGQAGTPIWNRLMPNSYSDFGGEVVTTSPNPINPSRQRRKGVITDLNAAGGFNHNMTFANLTDLMQGVMFADIRRKGRKPVTAVTKGASPDPDGFTVPLSNGIVAGDLVKGVGFKNPLNNQMKLVSASVAGSIQVAAGGLAAETGLADAFIDRVGHQFAEADIEVVTTGVLPTLESTLFDFTSLGLVAGQWIFVGGDPTANKFSNVANNGFKRIRSVSANQIVIDKSFQTMIGEDGGNISLQLFFGDVLRNESADLIRRRSYQLERTLGNDGAGAQSEVLRGAVPSEFTLNIPSSELVNADISFTAIDHDQRTSAEGIKQSNVKTFPVAKELNTSSDVGRLRLSSVSHVNAAPNALFAFVTEASISINNNLSANKAVGVLGAFDITAGTFAVSGSMTAYFSNMEAAEAVRNNADVTLDISFVKNGQGIVYDLPLISLGDGRLNVEIDQPITIPLNSEAASGEDVVKELDHTLLITYFNHLPSAAH